MEPHYTPVHQVPPARRLAWADITVALRWGYAMFRTVPGVSVAYATVFALPGLILLVTIGVLGLSPMALPFAGGFMLVGPILLTGYFAFADRQAAGGQPRLIDAFGAFRRAPPSLWLVALICSFLFLIWITDAGVLYSFTVGGAHLGYEWEPILSQAQSVVSFELWGSLMGSVVAYLIFTVSAFSVPLIYEHRVGLVEAVHASVRTVLGSFWVCLVWGLILGGVIVLSILLLPLLLIVLPVMSYASFGFYRAAFPGRNIVGST